MQFDVTVTSAVILAGGLGTRLRSVVPDVPKPMAPIGGRPFLEYQLDYWINQGLRHFVLSIGYRHEVIIDHFGDSYKSAKLDYVIEQTPLGTGGGFLLAAERVGKNELFLLLNGDTYFAVDLKTVTMFSQKNNADWCCCLFRTNEKGRYMGMSMSPEGKITSFKSNSEHTSQLVNGGVYLVHQRALCKEQFVFGDKLSLEEDILPVAMKLNQRLFGLEFSRSFIDIGVPDDYYRAQTILS